MVTPAQARWLARIVRAPRARVRVGGAHGIPEVTVRALERLELVRVEWQPMTFRHGGAAPPHCLYAVFNGIPKEISESTLHGPGPVVR